MAKVRSIFRMRGCLGGASFYERNGEQFVRTRPHKRKREITPAQKEVQEKFKLIHEFFNAIRNDVISEAWRYKARNRMSGPNLFFKTNYDLFDGSGNVDYSGIKIVPGRLGFNMPKVYIENDSVCVRMRNAGTLNGELGFLNVLFVYEDFNRPCFFFRERIDGRDLIKFKLPEG